VLQDHSPRHDGRDFTVKRKTVTKIEQLKQVRHGDVRHLMWILLLRIVDNVGLGRTRGHERVAANIGVRVVGSDHEELHVIHAGPLETEGGRRSQNEPKIWGWLLCSPATRCLMKIYVMAKKSGWRERKEVEVGRVIAGVEEKDRAFDRTLTRSLSRFGHNPARC